MTTARSDPVTALGEGGQQLYVEGADSAVLDAQDGNVIPILGDQHLAIIHAAGCRAGQWEFSWDRADEGSPLPTLGRYDEALGAVLQGVPLDGSGCSARRSARTPRRAARR
jgi:hypothetical protein